MSLALPTATRRRPPPFPCLSSLVFCFLRAHSALRRRLSPRPRSQSRRAPRTLAPCDFQKLHFACLLPAPSLAHCLACTPTSPPVPATALSRCHPPCRRLPPLRALSSLRLLPTPSPDASAAAVRCRRAARWLPDLHTRRRPQPPSRSSQSKSLFFCLLQQLLPSWPPWIAWPRLDWTALPVHFEPEEGGEETERRWCGREPAVGASVDQPEPCLARRSADTHTTPPLSSRAGLLPCASGILRGDGARKRGDCRRASGSCAAAANVPRESRSTSAAQLPHHPTSYRTA